MTVASSLSSLLDHFARMHRLPRCHQAGDLGAGGVALEHAVGEEDQAVTWLKRQGLYLVSHLGERPERQVGLQRHGLEAAVAESQRWWMAGVDDRGRPG
jgi:hypothetical protein